MSMKSVSKNRIFARVGPVTKKLISIHATELIFSCELLAKLYLKGSLIAPIKESNTRFFSVGHASTHSV